MSEGVYLNLLRGCLEYGEEREDRTGVGTRSLFGYQIRFNLASGFPLLTTKRIFWRGVVEELLWMLRGETNVRSLQEKGVTIWDEWADGNGDLGPVYGAQWRSWSGRDLDRYYFKDQIAEAQRQITEDPTSRRIIVSAWNVHQLDRMALPPCHMMFQFSVRKGDRLDCHMYQRSCDVFLGLPWNIAEYALLTHLMADVTGKTPGKLTISFGDVHLYANHVDQAREQLSREPRPMPELRIVRSRSAVWKYEWEDLALSGYDPHPAIPAPVAV